MGKIIRVWEMDMTIEEERHDKKIGRILLLSHQKEGDIKRWFTHIASRGGIQACMQENEVLARKMFKVYGR